MIPHPLKLLVIGYSAAALLGMGLMATGVGWLAAGLAMWLAGPVVVFALGTIPGVRDLFSMPSKGPLESEDERAQWVAREEELRAWDLDLARDSAEADDAAQKEAPRRHASGG